MEISKQKIAEWAARDFGGCTKEELRAACKAEEISVAPADGIETLRRKLLEKHGKWADKPSAVAPIRRKTRNPPNLRSVSGWEGKRYRVRLMPAPERGDAPIPVSWEGETFWLDPKKEYQDLPVPIYNNLKDATAKNIVSSKWNQELQTMVHTWSTFQRYTYQDFGVTPGTENLPGSLLEWYRGDCKAHDYYAKENRDSLERIWHRLTDGAHPNKEDRDRNTDSWREEILIFLGLIDEAMPAKEEAA